MARFVLRRRGVEPAPENELRSIRSWPGLKVVDASSPKMLLVEAGAVDVERLMERMPQWIASVERMIRRPDERPRTRRRSKGQP